MRSAALAALDPARPLVDQIRAMLSRADRRRSGWTRAPATSAREITAAVGGDAGAGAAHRLTRVRAIHRPADPEVLQARSPARYARDRSHSSRQLVSRVAARRTPRAARSRRRLRHEPDGSRVGQTGGRRRSTATAPGPRSEAAGDRAGVDRRRHAVAVLADALRTAGRRR